MMTAVTAYPPRMTLEWQHSDANRQWELIYDDGIYEPRPVTYVTDEFLAGVDMPLQQLKDYVRKHSGGVPLPDEAFGRTQPT
jgi:hypothetical protein